MDSDALSPALEALISRFADLVRGVGRRHGLSEPELDELIQAVRLRIWRARPTSEQIASTPSSYMYRTAMTAAIDVLRARRDRKTEPIETTRESGEMKLGFVPGPDDQFDAAVLADAIGEAVDAVTPSRRPVLRMYLAGYDREEIAQLMGWSEAKTRNLLYRGLADLRAELLARGIGPGIVQ